MSVTEPDQEQPFGRQREWLGFAIELHPFPAIVVDLQSETVVISNQQARDVFLTSPRILEPENDFAEFSSHRADFKDLAREVIATAARSKWVDFSWNFQGSQLHFRAYCRALPPSDGHGSLALLTFLDITEQRLIERDLRLVVEARDEFFSIAAHELKDPLFSLKLSNQLLLHTAARQGDIPPHLLHHIELCQRQTDRLFSLVDNLLDVSRILSRRLQLDIEAFDLTELVRDVVRRFQGQANVAGTTVSAEDDGPIISYLDRLKVEQIVGNLLSNAIKYGGGQPIQTRVRADGDVAIVEVQDQGPGIAPKDQERIFSRFERASGVYRKESLGLGLHIVRSYAEAHGGSVKLLSGLGQGSTFRVTLPTKRIPGNDSNVSQDKFI